MMLFSQGHNNIGTLDLYFDQIDGLKEFSKKELLSSKGNVNLQSILKDSEYSAKGSNKKEVMQIMGGYSIVNFIGLTLYEVAQVFIREKSCLENL